MKNTRKLLALVLVLMMVFAITSVITVSAAAGQTWTVAGSSALCGSNWSTTDTKNDMTYDAATDSYVKVYQNVKAGNYEFKCAKDHAWNTAYPSSNYNLKVEKDGSTVTITLKGTTVTAKVEAPTCDHAYEVTAATVTCLTAGSRTWTCSKCNDSYTENLNALGHHYDATGKCERCDETTTLVRVYVENAAKWADVYCYTWDTNPYVAWPGEKMNYDEESGLYYYDIPKIFVNVIFSNGAGAQSADLKTPTTSATIYNNSTKTWKAPHVCNFVAGEVVLPTYTTAGYTVYTCTCGKTENRDEVPALEVVLPEVVVTEIVNPDYTFALNFAVKDADDLSEDYIDALMAKYGKHYVDYVLTIEGLANGSVTLNANGEADGYFGGQYDAWDLDWVKVPYENFVINNGEQLYVMETAAKEMGKHGLRVTLEEVVEIVVDFDCGIYLTPEFLAANPDMKITLELIVFTEDAEGNKTLVGGEALVKNEIVLHTHEWSMPTCTEPAKCECGETYGEALGHTYFYNVCLVCGEVNPYFENNFTTVGDNKLVCNEYHLVDTDTHKCPYQFTLVTIPEDGLYIFTADATKLGVFIYTTEITTEGADFSVGGASWAAVTFGQAELKAGTYYLGFIFYQGVGEYDLTITKHEHEFVEGNCACGAVDPEWVAPHEHNFVEGKCECGEVDPDYVAPQPPVENEEKEELNFFQKILAWFSELISKLLAIFKK